jgi:predicted dehydrogenase
MERPIRVAIVGCGWAGARHASAYEKCGAEVGWAVDVDRRRAEALQKGGRVATDYQKALDDADLDAVDICLPHSLHAQVAVDAAKAGKHVLCEKPLAASLEEADRMIEAAERAGVVLMVAENVRFSPLYRKVSDFLKDGAIGRPALIQMTRQAYLTRSFLEDRRWFLSARTAAGGIMMSGGIHDFETMRMVIGEIESVYALRARHRFTEMEGDDTSIAMVRFHDGTVGTLVESFVMKSLTTAAGPEVDTLRIDGDLGSLSVEDGKTIRLFSERSDFLPGGSLAQHDIYVPEADTFLLEIEHFIGSIRTGVEPITSGRSQRRPLEVVLAAYRSMGSGGPVRLS